MRKALILGCYFYSITLFSQAQLDWWDLESGIFFKESISEFGFSGFQQADFSDQLTDLEGKEVSLIGYLLVLDGDQSVYMISKNPMASCFFCGNGGPETISEVFFDEKPSLGMDDLITVTGILRLNRSDPSRCYYSIEHAKGFGF